MLNIESRLFEKILFADSPLASGNYEKCMFNQCDFSETDLKDINFYECHFTGCNLSLAKFSKNTMNEVHFKDCKLVGLHFEYCNDILFTVTFEKCQLNLSSFYRMKAKKTKFIHCMMHEIDFTETDLNGSIFQECDLFGSIFLDTNLEKADFRTAYHYHIDPESNRIKKAKFSREGILGLLYKYDIDIE